MFDRIIFIMEKHFLSEFTLVGGIIPNLDGRVIGATSDQQRSLHTDIHGGYGARVKPILNKFVAHWFGN